ncbi:hypothetical protein HOLleu_02084 [Holothuria leucospilota]|uniref:Uncharacterized protein n=1 Tax=Holothuria leucospilota TaxID=206669 RepID=A0A9Q1CQ68_HOLLE|nr:hypothetical protein HOLleu_02084 [Holothuria leucospilota]
MRGPVSCCGRECGISLQELVRLNILTYPDLLKVMFIAVDHLAGILALGLLQEQSIRNFLDFIFREIPVKEKKRKEKKRKEKKKEKKR